MKKRSKEFSYQHSKEEGSISKLCMWMKLAFMDKGTGKNQKKITSAARVRTRRSGEEAASLQNSQVWKGGGRHDEPEIQ